jgi:surface protein
MMYRMFNGASSFNQNLSNWDVSNVINMQGMFTDATAFNQNLSAWDVSSVTNMDNMFDGGGWDRTSYPNLPTGTLKKESWTEVEWANYWTSS